MRAIYLFSIVFLSTTVFSQHIENLSVIVKKCDPGVVKILTYSNEGRPEALGSGCVISENGICVTNFHVLAGARKATVHFPSGETFEIKNILDYNEKTDLVKFQLKSESSFKYVRLKSGIAEKGTSVFALGYPNGFNIEGESTLSTGIISGTRIQDDIELLQTTTPITHGSSGGGLFDASGKLCGITTGTFAKSVEDLHANLNKVIPVQEVSKLTRNLNLSLDELFDRLIDKHSLVTAMYYYENQRWARAGGYFLEYLESNPTDATTWFRLGMCNYQLYRETRKEDFMKYAIYQFKTSIDLNPNYHYSHGQLAKLYLYIGNAEEAKLHVEKCASLKPNDSFTWYVLASYHGNQNVKNYSISIENYNKVVKYRINTENYDRLGNIYYERGITKIASGDNEGGLKDLYLCKKLDPKNKECLREIFINYYNRNKEKEACQAITELNQITSTYTMSNKTVSEWKKIVCGTTTKKTNNQMNQSIATGSITFKSKDKRYKILYTSNMSVMGVVTPYQPLVLSKNVYPNTTYNFSIYEIKKNGKLKYILSVPVPVYAKSTHVLIDGNSIKYSHYK